MFLNECLINVFKRVQSMFLNECIINVFNNYCPNKIITCNDKDAPWMTDDIKHLLKENGIYIWYVKNGYEPQTESYSFGCGNILDQQR